VLPTLLAVIAPLRRPELAIGNALDVVADNSVLPELLSLAQGRQHGAARQMIVSRLGRSPKGPDIVEILVGLLEDQDVAMHAMSLSASSWAGAGSIPAASIIRWSLLPMLGVLDRQVRPGD
jgi:hypothetical protein